MTTFKLDDLDLVVEDNKLVLIDGVDEVSQRMSTNFRFFLGEWFLNTELGVPYYQKVLGQKPRVGILQSVFRDAALVTNGVKQVNDIVIDYTSATRTLRVDMTVTSETGVFTYEKEFNV